MLSCCYITLHYSERADAVLFSRLTAVVGLLYPCIDSHLGEPHKFKREWASVMRCVAVFVGINHASAVSFHGHAVTRVWSWVTGGSVALL